MKNNKKTPDCLLNFKNYSIRTKLTLSNWLVSVIPIIVIFCILLVIFLNITLNNSKNLAQITLNKATEEVDLWFNQLHEDLVALCTDINVQNNLEAIAHSEYKEKLNIRDFIRNRLMTVYTSDMMAINTSMYIKDEQKTFSKDFSDIELYRVYYKEEWFQDILNGRSSFYLNEQKSVLNGKKVYVMASPIVSVKNGNILGLVYVELDREKIYQAFSLLVEGDSYAVLFGNERISSSTNNPNVKSISVFSQVDFIDLKVEYQLPVNELLSGYKIAIFYLVIGLISIMLIMFFSDGVLAKNFALRIVGLRNAMKQLASGDLSVRVIDDSADEIGDLSRSLNSMTEEMDNLIQERYIAEVENSKAKLVALQTQVNPHFIYNTLESISMLALIKDNYEIVEITQAFSEMMRYAMDANSLVTISDEIENVQNYLAIQKIRFQNKFQVVYKIEPECLTQSILRLSLQPLVENSFRHGFKNSPNNGNIIISIKKKKMSIIIRIFNDGTAVSKERITQIQELLKANTQEDTIDCFALRNLNKRLQIQYGKRCTLSIRSKKGIGTITSIKLPL